MTNEELEFGRMLASTFTWSFSRLTSFENCPNAWWRQYILEDYDRESSFAAENGRAVHKVLEEFLKGEIAVWDCSAKYDELFDKMVTHEAPYNKYGDLSEKTYNDCKTYFDNLQPLDDKYEILGVERKELFDVGDYHFIGYIDLLFRNKETGEITVSDHKSHRFKMLKRGGISKSDKPQLEQYKKQLYLYSINVLKEFGRVDYIRWNLFRQGTEIVLPWKQKEFDAAKEWAVNTVDGILKSPDFPPKTDNLYYCNNLCDYRNNCKFRAVQCAKTLESRRFEQEMGNWA